MASWTDPEWLARAHAWIDEQLAHLGRAATGTIEQQHVRPWSTVMRVPTDAGDVWFKANAPLLSFEAGLVTVLARRRPHDVTPLLAADVESGWMLMADAGPRLREIQERERDLTRWLDILPLYAGLQIELADDVDELLAAGVPDLRVATLTSKYERMLGELDGLPSADRRRLEEHVPWVYELCEELAGYGLPETIQHDDLHDGQVFVRDGRYLLLDWGDACVSHPFFSLSVTLEGFLAWGLDDVEGSVDLTPFLEAYLAPFADLGEGADLHAAARTAMRLGWVCRAANAHFSGSDLEGTQARLRMFLDNRP